MSNELQMPSLLLSRSVVVGLVMLTMSLPLGAQPVSSGRGRFLGLATMPALFAHDAEAPAVTNRRARITVRRAPSGRSAIVAVLQSADMIVAFETGPEERLPGVYGRDRGWILIHLVDGRQGWVAPADAGGFTSYEDELERQFDTYLTAERIRGLADAPGSRRLTPFPPDPRRRILGSLTAVGPTAVESRPGHVELLAAEVPAYAAPSPDAAVVTRFLNHWAAERLVTAESDDRVLVFSHPPGWFEVGFDPDNRRTVIHEERVWIRDDAQVWRFEPASDLATDGKAYYRLQDQSHGVQIVERRRIAGKLWLRVRAMLDTDCDRVLNDIKTPEHALLEGWIPALDSRGEPNVWWVTYCD